MSQIFDHLMHPHTARRLAGEVAPVKVADQHAAHSAYARFNRVLALRVTGAVGTMTCAYLFGVLALVSLPGVLAAHNVVALVQWAAQTFLQLVLLSVIIVGQRVMGEASDARGEQTYADAEAVLHEALEIQRHLHEQDGVLLNLAAGRAGSYAQKMARTGPANAGSPSNTSPSENVKAVTTGFPSFTSPLDGMHSAPAASTLTLHTTRRVSASRSSTANGNADCGSRPNVTRDGMPSKDTCIPSPPGCARFATFRGEALRPILARSYPVRT